MDNTQCIDEFGREIFPYRRGALEHHGDQSEKGIDDPPGHPDLSGVHLAPPFGRLEPDDCHSSGSALYPFYQTGAGRIMSKSRKDQRQHRRKAGKGTKGATEHAKREKRRKQQAHQEAKIQREVDWLTSEP